MHCFFEPTAKIKHTQGWIELREWKEKHTNSSAANDGDFSLFGMSRHCSGMECEVDL